MFRRRFRAAPARIGVLLLALLGLLFSTASANAATLTYPTYQLDATHSLSSSLRGDIAGSAFVDKDGAFHWLTSYATYTTTDSGSYTTAYTNSDLGAVNAQIGSGTTSVADDTYYDRPGSLCYQVDKAATHAAPSPYEDDHCDVVGVWVDPATGAWHAVVNDEYDFNPWSTTDPTVAQRITSGIHANRILTATSTDNGQNWTYGGEIITSKYTDDDAFDATALPGKTWTYGVAGSRLFVDYSTGYFYVVYNTAFKMKPGYTTFLSVPEVARAPISGGMAPGTWNKYYDGGWQQPGVAGLDAQAGDSLGLDVAYQPATDQIDMTGTGADGTHLDYRSVYTSSGTFGFDSADGTAYTAHTTTGTITDSTGAAVSSVTYQDPALGGTVTVAGVASPASITVSVTDANGTTRSGTVGAAVMEDTATHRIYLPSTVINESALTYNTYGASYLSVGYDKNAYQTFDLGKPDTLSVVGAEPSSASSSYLTSLDTGSLTNQNISTRSYRMLSALSGGAWDVTMAPHSSTQTHFVAGVTPADSAGHAVSAASAYGLTVGSAALTDAGGAQWKLVPVSDMFDPSYPSGVYRLQNTSTGGYLQAAGSTAAARRAIGASVSTGAAQADFDPAGNGGDGTPGGSDQWYLEPVGKDTAKTLSASSSAADIAAATNTSLRGVTTYKLVNRNSGLALENVGGSWQLAGQQFGDAGQTLTITAVS